MSGTVVFRLNHTDEKKDELLTSVNEVKIGKIDERTYVAQPETFASIPGAPFAYWVSDSLREKFVELPRISTHGFEAKQGLATADDFRFVRTWWEVDPANVGCSESETWDGKYWVTFAKGGAYSPFYADMHLVVNWGSAGVEIRNFYGASGRLASRPQNVGYYFRPGITWSLRSQIGVGFRAMPAGSIFGHKGPAIVASAPQSLFSLLSIMNSSTVRGLISLQMTFGSYEVGVIQRTPLPDGNDGFESLEKCAAQAIDIKRGLDQARETSHIFCIAALIERRAKSFAQLHERWSHATTTATKQLIEIQAEINQLSYRLYSIQESDKRALDVTVNAGEEQGEDQGIDQDEDVQDEKTSLLETVELVISSLLGGVYGRWDIRHIIDPSLSPDLQDPFAPLPACSPCMLVSPDGLPAVSGKIVSEKWLRARTDVLSLPEDEAIDVPTIADNEYPVRIAWDGVLVDDPQHSEDIIRRLREVLTVIWPDGADEIEHEACDILGVRELKDYVGNPRRFFDFHLKQYSMSRRKAPIYWPLSTASGSYTIWLYYSRLTSDTIYTAVNKYLSPKIASVERSIADIKQSLASASGREATQLQRELEGEQGLQRELIDMRDELLRIAALPYRPNLDDGVIINAAPFHRLFRHRGWARATEDIWKKLEKGDYDWAHLAYAIWPDRVRDVCRTDKSIAIAHGLEDLYVKPPVSKKKGKTRAKQRSLDEEDA